MDIKTEVSYDSGTADLRFSLRKQRYVEIEGERVNVGSPERTTVCPGDFDAVESFAPELLPVFRALWTEEAVAAYEAKAENAAMDM